MRLLYQDVRLEFGCHDVVIIKAQLYCMDLQLRFSNSQAFFSFGNRCCMCSCNKQTLLFVRYMKTCDSICSASVTKIACISDLECVDYKLNATSA